MASFLIVMAVTDPDAPPYNRHRCSWYPARHPASMFCATSALATSRSAVAGKGTCGMKRPRACRSHARPAWRAFMVAQTRLGGGRIHHAMRTVGLVRRIYDMMCERAVSRYTQGESLSRKQLVQEMIADSWMEIEAFRLLTLQTAWKIDQHNDYKAVPADISAVKAMMQKVLHDVSARALQIHGRWA